MAEDTKGKAKKKKDEEEPPPIEEKPFNEFIEQHFLPSLKESFAQDGIEDMNLSFEKKTIPILGVNEDCWQVEGKWRGGDRTFNLYFFDEDITGEKGFSYATYGGQPSTLESFMIDERKVNLDLMVLYTLQRINAEKWLGRN
ncbi:MAG: DUF2996 domain-containing protein [Kamptonema sp. SIO4C4]|nr:DUF2996 domain-containing protein [Kamptonema sp. SIO4C4]